MSGLSIANYGNSYTAAATGNAVTVRQPASTIVRLPKTTAIRDVYTPGTAVIRNTYTPGKAANTPAVNSNKLATDVWTLSKAEPLPQYMIESLAKRAEQLRQPPYNTNEYTIAISTYFGDTLVSTFTSTQTWTTVDGTTGWYTTSWNIEDQLHRHSPEYEAAEREAWENNEVTYKATTIIGGQIVGEYETRNGISLGYHQFLEYHQVFAGDKVHNVVVDSCHEGQVDGADTPLAETSKQDKMGIFTGSSSPLTSLGKLLGIEGTFSNKTSFLNALKKQIDEESKALTTLLSQKLGDAKLGDITKKVTFAEDADGNIVITGNISARKKKELARIIKNDPELAERIKTQKARMEIADELKKDGEVDKKTNKVYEADLSDKKFDAARTQLLKDFLRKNGTSLDEFESAQTQFQKDGTSDEQYKNLYESLNSFPELNGEIQVYIDRQNAP